MMRAHYFASWKSLPFYWTATCYSSSHYCQGRTTQRQRQHLLFLALKKQCLDSPSILFTWRSNSFSYIAWLAVWCWRTHWLAMANSRIARLRRQISAGSRFKIFPCWEPCLSILVALDQSCANDWFTLWGGWFAWSCFWDFVAFDWIASCRCCDAVRLFLLDCLFLCCSYLYLLSAWAKRRNFSKLGSADHGLTVHHIQSRQEQVVFYFHSNG